MEFGIYVHILYEKVASTVKSMQKLLNVTVCPKCKTNTNVQIVRHPSFSIQLSYLSILQWGDGMKASEIYEYKFFH